MNKSEPATASAARHPIELQPSSSDPRSGTVAADPLEPFALTNLLPLMEKTSGRPEIVIGLLDGPVAVGLAALTNENIRSVPNARSTNMKKSCSPAPDSGTACQHGTLVASVLSARRSSAVRGICPECTLLVRPIFDDSSSETSAPSGPQATPEAVAEGVLECMSAGARVINLSAAVTAGRSGSGEQGLVEAFDQAMKRGVLVVAAAGNQSSIDSSVITGHRWIIPVSGYSLKGRPLDSSNFSAAIGRGGLGAPGEGVIGISSNGEQMSASGTSVAAPFVTGTIALIWSVFPTVTVGTIKSALLHSTRRRAIVPPLIDAWSAYIRTERLI